MMFRATLPNKDKMSAAMLFRSPQMFIMLDVMDATERGRFYTALPSFGLEAMQTCCLSILGLIGSQQTRSVSDVTFFGPLESLLSFSSISQV